MKRKLIFTTMLLLLFPRTAIFAQERIGELNLSLKEAQEYAIKNNKVVKSARLDLEASKIAIWETISAGLPQVNASGHFTDNLKLMTTVLAGNFFGDTTGKKYLSLWFDSTIQVMVFRQVCCYSMLHFMLVLETIKLATRITVKKMFKKSELDTKESVSTAYFLILVSEKSLQILDGNIANLNETLKSTRAMYSAGMAESTDVDQMVSNVTMVRIQEVLCNVQLNLIIIC